MAFFIRREAGRRVQDSNWAAWRLWREILQDLQEGVGCRGFVCRFVLYSFI